MKDLVKKYYSEIIIFISLFVYFIFWNYLNSEFIENNNNYLSDAIKIYNYIPLISELFNKLVFDIKIKTFLGSIIFPSLVGVMLFKIFYKILGDKNWSLSLMLLSIFSTENYPFIKFFLKLITFSKDFEQFANKYENFEIIGFPIPSFSILYFLIIFYFSFRLINLNRKFFLFSTIFWLVGIHIHPVDGFLGIIYWTSNLILFSNLKKIKFEKIDLTIILLLYIINILIIFFSIDLNKLNISIEQSLPIYNLIFYFIIPAISIFIIIKMFKVDMYEFFIKFSVVYILMLSELLLISLSLLGIGVELQMLENRITLFLLHYLYYVPIIYYLSKDPIFYEKFLEKKLINKYVKITFYFIFNKYKLFYLLPFSMLLILYSIISLKI